MPARIPALYAALPALVALAPAGARAAEQVPIIWYRYSGGCPTGEEFVARLGALGQKARLAGVRDAVDFVVTLGSSEGRSQGRLERQTTSGTVAIRDVEAESCDSVGKALAFSLVLTLNPEASVGDAGGEKTPPSAPASLQGPTSAPEPDSAPAARTRAASSARSSGAGQPGPLPSRSTRPTEARAPGPSAGSGAATYRVGAELGAAWGITPHIQPRAGVSLGYGARTWPARPAFRATAVGGYGSSETSSGDLRVGLAALELEACAWGWTDGATGIEPCAGVELGFISAKNEGAAGLADSGPWGTGFVRGRIHHIFGRRWGLEAHIGGFAPWFHYDYAGTEGRYSAYRVKVVGLGGALGAFFGLD